MKDHAAKCVQKTRRAAALLAGALALSLLAGCRGSEGQPVVTDDDLTPGSAVQQALNLDAGNGKNYAYVWADSDPEELAEVIIEANDLEARLKAWQEDLEAEVARGNEDQIRQRFGFSLEEALLECEKCRNGEKLKEEVQEVIRAVQAELALDPVVSPQEAANRAGALIEETYGIPLTGQKLILSCSQTDPTAAVMNHYNGRMVWTVHLMQPDDSGTFYRRFSGVMDATTGEWIKVYYYIDEDERQAMYSTPVAGFFTGPAEAFDTEDPAWLETVETEKVRVVDAFTKSSLADGAAITEVRVEEVHGEMAFYLTCDNGKTYKLLRCGNHFEYDFDGYPLRAYGIWNEEFLYDIPADGTM